MTTQAPAAQGPLNHPLQEKIINGFLDVMDDARTLLAATEDEPSDTTLAEFCFELEGMMYTLELLSGVLESHAFHVERTIRRDAAECGLSQDLTEALVTLNKERSQPAAVAPEPADKPTLVAHGVKNPKHYWKPD